MAEKKGETERCFIRRKTKWNIQLKLDQIPNALKLSKFYTKFVNGECWQQKLWTQHFLSWLGSSKNKEKMKFWKLIRSIKTKTEH